jgi:hypothetical protein
VSVTHDDQRFMLPSQFIFPHRPGILTDPIGMEYSIEAVDPEARNRLVALRFETLAGVYRLLADEAAKAAQITTDVG